MLDSISTGPRSVTVSTQPWYKSRIIWAGLVVFAASLASGLQHLIETHTLDWGHAIALALGGLVAGLRAAAPDVITGIAALDKQP